MKRLLTLIGVLGALALAVGVNLIAENLLPGRQIDLTQGGLYTLSSGTRQIVAGLHNPITLRLYYSESLGSRIPQYGAHADRVREMLRHYAELSGGKIHLEFRNPEPFSDSEDRALAEGLQAVPLNDAGERVFFGLSASNLLDDERSIAFFQPERERFLEYDLTRVVQDLSAPKRATLGVMSPLPLDGDPRAMMQRQGGGAANGAPWTAMLGLRESFAVKTVPLDATAIDPDIQVLFLAQAQALSDATLYAIDQFIMRGGRLMAMFAPHSESLPPDPATGAPPASTSADLGKLLAAWGVSYDPEMALGDLTGAWKVRAGSPSRPQSVDYVGFFSVRDGLNRDDPATAELAEITIANSGFLTPKPGSAMSFTPLLTSSPRAQPIPASAIRANPDPTRLLASFKPDGERRVIAARLRGPLKSAFDKAPDGSTHPYLSQTEGPANLVLIADVDMLADRFWTRSAAFFGASESTPFADNGAFIVNLAGTLAGGDALIGLRTRGSVARPFDVVEDMQREAEQRYRQTEQTLSTHLQETTKKLTDIRAGRDGSANAALNDTQRQAVDALKADLIDTRVKLRLVQRDLRQDIQRLEGQLRLFNIVLIPAVLVIGALALGLWRRRRHAA